jgi:outer membrane protein assembly factor BamD
MTLAPGPRAAITRTGESARRGYSVTGTRPLARALARLVAKLGAVVFASAMLAACGDTREYDETAGWSAQRIYEAARGSMASGAYTQAIKFFERLEARYPYGRYAQQAQLEVAYAYYKDGETASAVAAADRFIKLYPNHPTVDYAHYVKGLAHFNENRGIFGGFGGQDPSERDPKAARDAFDTFRELAQRFPDSKYTPDALDRMRFLVNGLAQHEVSVARYYMRRGAYVAATNRAQFALKTYPDTPAIEEALAIMVGAYEALGLNDLASDSRRVLEKNYPKSTFIDRVRAEPNRSWWRLW